MSTLLESPKAGRIDLNDFKRPFRAIEKFLGKSDTNAAVHLSTNTGRICWAARAGRLTAFAGDTAPGIDGMQTVAVRLGDVQAALRAFGTSGQSVEIAVEDGRLVLTTANETRALELLAVEPVLAVEADDDQLRLVLDCAPQRVAKFIRANKGHHATIKVAGNGNYITIESSRRDTEYRTASLPLIGEKLDRDTAVKFAFSISADELRRVFSTNDGRHEGTLTRLADGAMLWAWGRGFREDRIEVLIDAPPLVDDVPATVQAPCVVATAGERGRLDELESIVERDSQAFYNVGGALREIRDFRLYEKVRGVATFETYIEHRFGMRRSFAYYLIAAADLKDNLSTMVDRIPANERQARALIGLPPADQQEVWQEVLERAPKNDDGEPLVTARVVKEVRDEMFPREDEGDDGEWDADAAIHGFANYLEKTWLAWPREHLDLLVVQLQSYALKVQKDIDDGDAEGLSA